MWNTFANFICQIYPAFLLTNISSVEGKCVKFDSWGNRHLLMATVVSLGINIIIYGFVLSYKMNLKLTALGYPRQ